MRRTFLASIATLPLLAACMTGPGEPPMRVVFFTEDSPALGPVARDTVNDAAVAANRMPNARIVVRGYAGPAGGRDANVALSTARALAVTEALRQAGVNPDRVTVQPRGPVPFEAVPTESRRVEIYIGT